LSPAERSWAQQADREVIRPDEGYSVRWAEHSYPADIARWNYHPEYELHLIRKSEGRFIVGDTVGLFLPGQVTLVGPGIPHDWISFLEPGEVVVNRDALIQFDGEWLANCSSLMPELDDLAPLLEHARRGVVFHGQTAATLATAIDSMGSLSGIDRLLALIGVFRTLARAPEIEVEGLESNYTRHDADLRSTATVDLAVDYIFKNLTGYVSMSEAARLANMSESTFSKYFKRASGMTFTEMVAKLRISHACRLLETTDEPISSISESVGFTNLSNFNRQFRRVTGSTPREHRRTSPRRRVRVPPQLSYPGIAP